MNISLPDTMKTFVETQVSERGYGTSSEFIRELIRKEQDRAELRTKILEGLASPVVDQSVDEIFDELEVFIGSLGDE
jgi:antitoxin ParD1/3/4